MPRLLGILFTLSILAAVSSEAFAKDTKPLPAPQVPAVQKTSQSELVASSDLGFAPDGLARDVLSLMAGVSHPIDSSTNLTVQAGKGLRIGLTF